MKLTKKFLLDKGFEPVSESELERRYADMLDDVYGDVKIAGYEYPTSRALAEIDPTAFRCGYSDFLCDETLTEVEGEYFETSDIETAECLLDDASDEF